MKKLKITLIVLISVFILSCSSNATYLASQVYIGMPISNFIDISQGRAKIESMRDGFTIYKATNKDANGYIHNTKFFYFDSNGKLVQMDGGVSRQERSQIEIINK